MSYSSRRSILAKNNTNILAATELNMHVLLAQINDKPVVE